MIPSYIYAVLWYILAAYLIYMAIKETRFFFVPAAFFVFLGTWALVDLFIEPDLMSGVYGWIYRGVALVVLIICTVWYFLKKKSGS